MGEIGILATLEDSGIHEVEQEMFFEDIAQLELHPIQFDEAVAYLTYSSLLMTRTPTYLISVPYGPQDPTIVTCTPIMGLSRKPLFREWDNEAYSRILHAYWGKYGVDLTDIYQPPNLVRTVLFDDDGKLIQMNNDGKLLSKLNSKFRDT